MICGWGLGELLGSLLSELLGCWGDVAALLIIAGFAVLACADRFKARRCVDSFGGWFLGCDHKTLVALRGFHRPPLASGGVQGAVGQRSRYLLMQIAVCVAFARACRHSERVLYGVPWPPSDVTR